MVRHDPYPPKLCQIKRPGKRQRYRGDNLDVGRRGSSGEHEIIEWERRDEAQDIAG